jgi:hypothetical protein
MSRFEAKVREPELHDVGGIRVSDSFTSSKTHGPRPGEMHKNGAFLFLPFQGQTQIVTST